MNGKVITTPTEVEPPKKAGEGRTRNYATVVYPESAPEDWISILEEEKIPALISPLHDRDINQTAEKTPKKPHYHVIVMFSSVKTQAQARGVFEKIGGVGCEVVQSTRGYARYLCHLDNPEKAKYDENNIISLCGADYYSLKELQTDKLKIIKEMCDWCIHNEIEEIFDLIEYARAEREDWFRELAFHSTIFMKEYLKSARFKRAMNKSRNWKRSEPDEQ